MNTIRPIGQAITSTNYTAQKRLFNFNPEPIREAAENFLAAGITELEIPIGVLDPDGRCPEEGVDRDTLGRTVAGLPAQTRVIASYIGGSTIGKDNAAFLETTRRQIDHLVEFFPHVMQTMVHPAHIPNMTADDVRAVVNTWAELAAYADQQKPGFQCCLHNHYDSSCETAEQMRTYLDALRAADQPALRWGPDLGHCGGMGDQFLPVLEDYADLIGNHFHIKTRVPAFDPLHEPERYREDRDMWSSKAEFGRGLYGGFVCCADPEIETPLTEAFAIIREKAQPTDGVVTGAIEIDIPRQHPRLEILCSVLYLKAVHGIEPSMALSYEDIVKRAFGV